MHDYSLVSWSGFVLALGVSIIYCTPLVFIFSCLISQFVFKFEWGKCFYYYVYQIFLVRFYIFYPAKYFIVNIEFILLIVYCEEEEIKSPVPFACGQGHGVRICNVIHVESKKKTQKRMFMLSKKNYHVICTNSNDNKQTESLLHEP